MFRTRALSEDTLRHEVLKNASLTVDLEIPQFAARTREEGSRDEPSKLNLPDFSSSQLGGKAVRGGVPLPSVKPELISNAMIARRRRFSGRDCY
jgi:hypothetical protein